MVLCAIAAAFTMQAHPKPQIFVFLLTDCPISRQYMPEIKKVSAKYKAEMIFVHEDPTTTMAQAKMFNKEFSVDSKIQLDPKHTLAKELKVVNVPTVALKIAGKIVYVGRIDNRYPALGVQKTPTRNDLRSALDETLAGKAVSIPRTTVVGCVLPLT